MSYQSCSFIRFFRALSAVLLVLVEVEVSRVREAWREAGREDEGRRKASDTWTARRERRGQHRRRRRCMVFG